MKVAIETAKLSTAKKLKVGAIVVKDNRIISIGYNGMPSGWDNECENLVLLEGVAGTLDKIHPNDYDIYCELKSKPEVLHAEANAITKLARSPESGEGAAIFVTHTPCIECAKLIYQSGITEVYYANHYDASKGSGWEFLQRCGIRCEYISPDSTIG